MDRGQWRRPLADLQLSGDDIHLWRASLDQPASCVRRLAQTLSADERLRAERFRFERDRLRFIVGRGVLRAILGRYLGLEPGQLRFRYGSCGKPSLAKTPDGGWGQIHFNVAHSEGLALYAVAPVQGIGVDLEHIRPIAEADRIVQQFFSARERAMFRRLSASQRQEAFPICWICKEAYLKANGRGLDGGLDKVEVLFAPGKPPRLLCIDGDWQEASRWFIQTLTPLPGYVAAVAAKGRGWGLEHWNFGLFQ